MNYKLYCSCKQIEVAAFFPTDIENYQARACDCSFCLPLKLAYLSDANGSFSFGPKAKMEQLKQGSNQAIFWQCKGCKDIIGVTYQNAHEVRGALSQQLFLSQHNLLPAVEVSPKTLSPTEKTQRWSAVWSKVLNT
ncbi:hypothetical protein [Paraglaciecola aestuariivivens]